MLFHQVKWLCKHLGSKTKHTRLYAHVQVCIFILFFPWDTSKPVYHASCSKNEESKERMTSSSSPAGVSLPRKGRRSSVDVANEVVEMEQEHTRRESPPHALSSHFIENRGC